MSTVLRLRNPALKGEYHMNLKSDKIDTKRRYVPGRQMLSCERGEYGLKKWGSRTLDGLTPCGVLGCPVMALSYPELDKPRPRARLPRCQKRASICLKAAQWEAKGEKMRE